MSERVPVIYVAVCIPTGKVYVGQTVNFSKRRHTHKVKALFGSSSCPKFYLALRKYGMESFKWVRIICTNESELDSWETYWIRKLDAVKSGYNCAYGGIASMRGRTHTAETKVKISASHFGIGLGKKLSKETIEKRSASVRGSHRSLSTRIKQALAATGRILSLEARDKISKAGIGRVVTPETRAKISAYWRQRRECGLA